MQKSASEPKLPVVVYSHLRWDSVFQRPHHILTRLARRHRILFIEEPQRAPNASSGWELHRPYPGLLVAKPLTPVDAPGFDEAQTSALVALTRELLLRSGTHEHIAWLYTPMAFRVARALRPSLVVYDCMDELSAFLGAPPTLRAQEKELFASADVVFTGGRSLYRAKQKQSAHVRCFPSSVDAPHFARAQGLEDHPAQAAVPHPRLGFFGVIDERIDLALLATLADARPDWQIVLVGPVVKIDPATLPQRPNIHYLGRRPYEELPQLLAGWDVCLLPFAMNEATRYISPTKTLEYMAAERQIVSTPVVDVAEPYGEIAYVADGPEAFVVACERALTAGTAERTERFARMRDVLARTSWDETVRSMQHELGNAEQRRRLAESWSSTVQSSSSAVLPAGGSTS